MYYEEEFIDGVWYWRSTPDGEWSVKKLQMAKADEPKWQNGHAIASSETDKKPPCPLCGTEEQLNCFISGEECCGQPDLLAEAVKVIEFYAENNKIEGFGFHEDIRKRARDFLAKIER